jgi:hypothetical protein
MYAAILLLHSWVRWLVIAAGLVAVYRGAAGSSGHRSWTPPDDRAGFWFTMAVDFQMLLGLLLYGFLSPLTSAAMKDIGGAMKDSTLRYWAVEHAFGMIVAVVLVHVGRVRVRKSDSLRRHRTAAIFFGLALLAILASIPWPFTPTGRPLLRW